MVNQIRPINVEFGLIQTCDGSARLALGDTKVLAAVHGPRPARSFRIEDPEAAQLDISVIPSSGPSGVNELFIATTLRSVFDVAVLRSAHPRTIISIAIHIQVDDGSVLSAAINATTLALVDAGVPMRGMPGGVSAAVLGPAAFLPSFGEDGAASAASEAPISALDSSRYEESLPRFVRRPAVAAGSSGSTSGAGQASAAQADETAQAAAAGNATVADLLEEPSYDVSGSEALSLARTQAQQALESSVQLHASATAVYMSNTVGNADVAPTAFHMTGSLPWSQLQSLTAEMRLACATVLAFLRLACKQKVLRDSVNFERDMSVSAAELAGAPVGPKPAAAGAVADDADEGMDSLCCS